jgi:hypothetical protein
LAWLLKLSFDCIFLLNKASHELIVAIIHSLICSWRQVHDSCLLSIREVLPSTKQKWLQLHIPQVAFILLVMRITYKAAQLVVVNICIACFLLEGNAALVEYLPSDHVAVVIQRVEVCVRTASIDPFELATCMEKVKPSIGT